MSGSCAQKLRRVEIYTVHIVIPSLASSIPKGNLYTKLGKMLTGEQTILTCDITDTDILSVATVHTIFHTFTTHDSELTDDQKRLELISAELRPELCRYL